MEPALNVISGVAGTLPARGTIGEVVWATWLVDYDLGHRWAPLGAGGEQAPRADLHAA
ncbi:hypothetical protein [Ramlibacter sp. AN1133]|uniref:hypothetical protein n=1 Tax=Ramlibacter sp. AN1133 TaxID=3133429 RepID=UPI0030C59B83